jgi:hypothetical protein
VYTAQAIINVNEITFMQEEENTNAGTEEVVETTETVEETETSEEVEKQEDEVVADEATAEEAATEDTTEAQA